MTITVREAFFDFCRTVGMTTIFGNPGSTEIKMYREFASDFTYVLALQETVAVAAAAGHAMGTGKPALVSLHSAGGVGHSLGAVFNAYRDRVPVVIVAGQQTRAMLPHHPFLGADEPTMFPRPYVKWSRQPERAEDVPAALAEAYRVATTPPCGPVFLSVPEDDWDRPAQPVPAHEVRTAFAPDPKGVAELAEALNAAANPVLVVGPGVDDEGALPEVVELAERIGAPVWISPLSGRSGFPEDHALFRGFLPPVRGQVRERLHGHDVVLVLGAPIFTFHVHEEGPTLPEGARLFHLDCDPAQIAWAPVGTSLLTTIRSGLHALLPSVQKVDRPLPEPRFRPARVQAADPIDAGHVMDTLRDLIPEGAIVVEEVPSYRATVHSRLPTVQTGGFLTTGSGALGWGLPVAVGRALAAQGERVVCIIGDGSIMYSIQALWTAAKFEVPLTVLVLNNQGYGAVEQLARRFDNPDMPGMHVTGLDIPSISQGMGVPSRTVHSVADLEAALAGSLSISGPYVLDVRVAPLQSAAYE